MLASTIFDEVRFLTATDTSTYTDTDLLRGLNILQAQAVIKMMIAQGFRPVNETEFITDFVSTTGLVAGDNGYMGEYGFDSNWIKPTKIQVQFDVDDSPLPCNLYDLSENDKSESDEDEIDATFDDSEPYARFQRETYLIRPLNTGTTVVGGIHIWAEKRQTDLTSTSQSPIMESNLHDWYIKKLAVRFGKFREGITLVQLLRDIEELEDLISQTYRQKLRTPKKLTINQINFA